MSCHRAMNLERLLASSREDRTDSTRTDSFHTPSAHHTQRKNWLQPFCRPEVVTALLCVSIFSIAVNLISITWLSFQPQKEFGRVHTNHSSTREGRSPYTGLGLDVPSIYHHQTDYWSTNQTLTDELWEDIDTNPMVVALTDDYADRHNLPRSDRFPWNNTKGRYFIKVFHQLHCLKFIRRAFVDYERGRPASLNGRHVHHCLDTLRKVITCMADDTPMPTGEEARAIGDGQPIMCRSLDALVDWIYAPERYACHRALDDYRSITHSIERYAFCTQGTNDYVRMKQYFDTHGHVDPWK